MRQQFAQTAVGPGGQLRQHILEIGPGVDLAQLGRFDQRHEHGGSAAGLGRAHEEPILTAQGERPNRVFHRVVIDRHAPIGGKHTQRPPPAQRIVDGPRRGVGLGQERALPDQPGVQGIEQGLALALAQRGAPIGRMLLKGLLNGIQGFDALKRLLRDGAARQLVRLEELSAYMRPAPRLHNAPLGIQRLVAAEVIGEQGA